MTYAAYPDDMQLHTVTFRHYYRKNIPLFVIYYIKML